MSVKSLATFGALFEALELIKVMKGLIPIAIFFLNFVIGGMVASGRVNPVCQNDVVNAFIDVGGYILLFMTSIASLIHAVNHKPGTTAGDPITTQTVKTETKTEQVFTDTPPVGSGTPPPAN